MADVARKSFATALVERGLLIPSEPEAPVGAPGSVRVFRAAPNFYRYRLLQWLGKEIAAAAGLAFGLFIVSGIPHFRGEIFLEIVEAFGILSFLVMIPITYVMVHLDYQLRWYIVTDRSLRIREGLVRTDEKTMSFANIQNVSIRQGPIQHLLDIADVEVRTAGGGGTSAGGGKAGHSDMHLGYFRGVDNAEEIRDSILDRVRHLRDTGIGDPEADHLLQGEQGEDVLAAARELLAAARALRANPS